MSIRARALLDRHPPAAMARSGGFAPTRCGSDTSCRASALLPAGVAGGMRGAPTNLRYFVGSLARPLARSVERAASRTSPRREDAIRCTRGAFRPEIPLSGGLGPQVVPNLWMDEPGASSISVPFRARTVRRREWGLGRAFRLYAFASRRRRDPRSPERESVAAAPLRTSAYRRSAAQIGRAHV